MKCKVIHLHVQSDIDSTIESTNILIFFFLSSFYNANFKLLGVKYILVSFLRQEWKFLEMIIFDLKIYNSKGDFIF